jgi:hypothetical protein
MNTNEKQEHIMGRVLLTAFRNGFVYDRTNAIHSGFKIHRQEYTSENLPYAFPTARNRSRLYNAQTWPSIRLREAAPGHIDTPNLMKLLGNLYRHGILQPDYKKNGFDEIRDERKKVCFGI